MLLLRILNAEAVKPSTRNNLKVLKESSAGSTKHMSVRDGGTSGTKVSRLSCVMALVLALLP